jgi:APA family basic amino acid/polyamine antiporter
MSIWRKKSLSVLMTEASEDEKGLKRTLSSRALVALGIGAIIGAGLFSLTRKQKRVSQSRALKLLSCAL